MAINTYLSTITLNASELNAPIKRHMVAEWITRPLYMQSIRDSLHTERYPQTENKGMEKDIL